MLRNYNPDGPFKRTATAEMANEHEERAEKHFVPQKARVDAIIRTAPVSDEEMRDLTSRAKDKPSEDYVPPNPKESYNDYTSRLAMTGQTPNYRLLIADVRKRDDLQGQYWDQLKSSAAAKLPAPNGEASSQSTTSTKAGERSVR